MVKLVTRMQYPEMSGSIPNISRVKGAVQLRISAGSNDDREMVRESTAERVPEICLAKLNNLL